MTVTDTQHAATIAAPVPPVGQERRSKVALSPVHDAIVHETETIRVDWRKGETITALVPAWRSLAARTGQPNIFHDPDFLLPAVTTLGLLPNLETVAAWERAPRVEGRPRLLGIFPFLRHRPWGLPITVAQCVTHAYGPAGTPPIDSENARDVMRALVDAFASSHKLPQVVSVPFLSLSSDVATALVGAPYRQAHFGGYLRAMLSTELDGEAYLNAARKPKQRKRMAQQARQLAKLGTVETRSVTGSAVAAAAERFLTIERKGWKGRRGTAMASDDKTATMFRDLTGRLGHRDQCVIYELTLDDQVIASFVLLIAGSHGWLWKGAFDEDYARQSPGQLLTEDLVRQVLTRHPGLVIDSCALPGHPMIEHIFRERIAYADLLLDVREDGHGLAFPTAVFLETLRRSGRHYARQLLKPWRELRARGMGGLKRAFGKAPRV
ncbi:MAG: GNAT family N-acetyltransferase [Pseudomonadota bacterium]